MVMVIGKHFCYCIPHVLIFKSIHATVVNKEHSDTIWIRRLSINSIDINGKNKHAAN